MPKHYSDAKTARNMAMNNWGSKHETQEEAIKKLGSTNVSEGALLELVRRLNQAISAWAKDDDESDPIGDGPYSWSIPFPDTAVGDVLYNCCELDDSYGRYVVLSKDENGYVRCVQLQDDGEKADTGGKIYANWGDKDFRTTAAEAVRVTAEQDIKYHGRRYERAKAVLAAINKGKPFEHLLRDVDDDKEEEAEST